MPASLAMSDVGAPWNRFFGEKFQRRIKDRRWFIRYFCSHGCPVYESISQSKMDSTIRNIYVKKKH